MTKSVDAVRLWDTKTGSEVRPLTGHKDTLMEASFSGDGKRLITTSNDKTARLWNSKTGAEIAILASHEDAVLDAAFSPDGTHIVTRTGKTLRLWSAPTKAEIVVFKHDDNVSRALFSPDGKRIVTVSNDTMRVWDVDNTGAPLAVVKHKTKVNHAAFSPDGLHIVTASDEIVRIFHGTTGAEVAALKPRGQGDLRAVVTAAFSPDGARIVTGSFGKARVWDVGKRSETDVVVAGSHAVFSPDGTQIMTVTNDNVIRFWDAATAKETSFFKIEDWNGATLSPDGTRVVTMAGSETHQGRAIVWDMTTKARVAVARSENGQQLNSAVFSPDGSRILTASNDETARMWSTATGAPIAVLSGHDNVVNTAAFNPDGTRIVTASGNTVRVSPVFSSTKALVEQARHDVTRCLTTAERSQYFLAAEPPGWCIEMGKWPYSTPEWKTWLAAKISGEALPLPAQAD